MHGVVTLSMIPVRKEPTDRSEMVSQLLFGETFEVLEKEKSWSRIRIDADGYEGWIDSKQITPLSDEEFSSISKAPVSVSLDPISPVTVDAEKIPVVMGSTLSGYSNHKFSIASKNFSYNGNVIAKDHPDIASVSSFAKLYMHAPYLWGGRSPFGIDCSGFTQVVFKMCGIKLLRDAWQQSTQGTNVALEEAKEGDLAFFKNADNKIVHVGIVLPDHKIIHASGKVRIDTLDSQGIFNEETGQHSHSLAFVRRVSQ